MDQQHVNKNRKKKKIDKIKKKTGGKGEGGLSHGDSFGKTVPPFARLASLSSYHLVACDQPQGGSTT